MIKNDISRKNMMSQNLLLYFLLTAQSIILIIFIFLYIKEKIKNKTSTLNISRPKTWDFDDADSDRFIITNVNMQKINSWNDPQIRLWLLNPVGYGMRVDDKKYKLEGRVKNPPQKGSVKIFVLLSATEIFYQGEYLLNEKGEWKGFVFLATGPDEEYKKIIRLELYEWKDEEKQKIDTYDIIIE